MCKYRCCFQWVPCLNVCICCQYWCRFNWPLAVQLLALSSKCAVLKFGDESPMSVWNLVVCLHNDWDPESFMIYVCRLSFKNLQHLLLYGPRNCFFTQFLKLLKTKQAGFLLQPLMALRLHYISVYPLNVILNIWHIMCCAIQDCVKWHLLLSARCGVCQVPLQCLSINCFALTSGGVYKLNYIKKWTHKRDRREYPDENNWQKQLIRRIVGSHNTENNNSIIAYNTNKAFS